MTTYTATQFPRRTARRSRTLAGRIRTIVAAKRTRLALTALLLAAFGAASLGVFASIFLNLLETIYIVDPLRGQLTMFVTMPFAAAVGWFLLREYREARGRIRRDS